MTPQHKSDKASEQNNHACKGAPQVYRRLNSSRLKLGTSFQNKADSDVPVCIQMQAALGTGTGARARVLVREGRQPCRNVRRRLLRGTRSCPE